LSNDVITLFDPWKNKLCTCPPKVVLSPYVGCAHACAYCYITSYIPKAFLARSKKDFVQRLERSLERRVPNQPIEMAASSDVYQPLEAELGLTRTTLKLLAKYGCRVQILTKSDLVLRDRDILTQGRFSVGMSVTTVEDSIAANLEPNAPSPSKRMSALRRLTSAGIPTFARIDPIIPWINDSGLEKLVAELGSAGVRHVTCSTFKARWDSLHRVVSCFPGSGQAITTAYREGKALGRTMYLPKGLRLALMSIAKKSIKGKGMTFATCREGLEQMNSGATCDGTHLIP